MRARKGGVDKPLVLILTLLVIGGSMIFASAAFGLLARGTIGMSSVVFSHLVLGVGAGIIALIIMATIDYQRYRTFAPHIFIFMLIATALVFVPHIGAAHGGGKRWIIIAHVSLQPSEFLKIASIILAAAYFSNLKGKITSYKYGLLGLGIILAGPVLLLVAQPDIGTLGVICISVLAIYWGSGARTRDIALMLVIALFAIAALATFKPYVRDRVVTFFHPSQGQQSQGYQIKQSLIAIGSGGILGRGFGQGIQKFTYLPEPMGDSIFAVAGEELGFLGTVFIVFLFLAFALRGFTVAAHARDMFGSLLAIGISTYLVIEAFINIASMLGVAPLTGIPLTFISQGGSAMLASLLSAGILLNISRGRALK